MTRSGAALQLPLELDTGSTPPESAIQSAPGKPDIRSAEERVRQEVARGGARFERILFTRNRRVMASAADRGRTLRLHEVFRQAPADVLRALGENFSARRRATRQAARALIRSFLASAPIEMPPARPRRPAPVRRSDLHHLARLRACFDSVNAEYFGGALPRVEIRLSGRMSRRIGHFTSDPLEIVISRSLCTDAADGEAEATLRHEMIHLWQWCTGAKPGHGPDFRRWALRLGIHPRATREVCWK